MKRRSVRDIQIHNARLASDEVTVHDGIPVTTPARTLVDLAAVLRPHELERAVNQAEILRLPCPDLDRYRGRRGVTKLRDPEPTPTRSELEDRFVAFLDAHGLPRPLINRRVGPHEVDFASLGRRLTIELDGFATHGTRQAFERDRARDQRLQAAGWRVVRITWRRLHRRQELARLLPRLFAST